jgi:hypothetical protein
LSLSDNQKTTINKILANRAIRTDHDFATGRHFKFRLSLPFSPRLSRDIGQHQTEGLVMRCQHENVGPLIIGPWV